MLQEDQLTSEIQDTSSRLEQNPERYISLTDPGSDYQRDRLSQLKSIQLETLKTLALKNITWLLVVTGSVTELVFGTKIIIDFLQEYGSESTLLPEDINIVILEAFLLILGTVMIGFGGKLHPSDEKLDNLKTRRRQIEDELDNLLKKTTEYYLDDIVGNDGELLVELAKNDSMTLDELLNQ